MKAGLLAVMAMCAGLGAACAADLEPRHPSGYTCADVVHHVRKYGIVAARLWAKVNGVSRAEIRAAEKCLRQARS